MKELLKEKKYRKILKNPDLKVLYNINRKKMIKMIKSQSKTNKLKLSLIGLKDIQHEKVISSFLHLYTISSLS